MRINGQHYETIWLKPGNPGIVQVIDQRKLPFRFEIFDLKTAEDVFFAIKEMVIRGAPLIGVTAAYGLYLSALGYKGKNLLGFLKETALYLKSSRPTAVNLAFALDEMLNACIPCNSEEKIRRTALGIAEKLKQKEIENCNSIGDFGLPLIEEIYIRKKEPVNILTHCNAGWLACIDWGTATAPVYKAFRKGIPVHVWVDETRPRNQGARLTAFELGQEGVPYTVIADNTGGYLMQHGLVDLAIVGSDRTTANGDVANKIGTYLKALAAFDNHVPFYVALPSSTIDWGIEDGLKEIPIEQRDSREVSHIEGWDGEKIILAGLLPEGAAAANYGFDVTPARLVTGLITERGICPANKKSIFSLFPEKL